MATQPQNGWQLLYEEVQRQTKLDESLEAIAAIVSQHPEWVQQAPELKKHLTVVGKREEAA